MKIEPSNTPSTKGGVSPSNSNHEKELAIEDDVMVVTHHSYDDDDEYDDRKYPEAQIA